MEPVVIELVAVLEAVERDPFVDGLDDHADADQALRFASPALRIS